jgi:hypothetical protein
MASFNVSILFKTPPKNEAQLDTLFLAVEVARLQRIPI